MRPQAIRTGLSIGQTICRSTPIRSSPAGIWCRTPTTTGYSRYNALELNLRYARANGNVAIGYTYGKSIDVASNLGEQVNPFDIAATEAPSAFDLRHNFVASYTYNLPLERLFGRVN